MKPIYEHRIMVAIPRTISRETIKKLDKIMEADLRTSKNYTGLVGRNMCFQFQTEVEKVRFREIMQVVINDVAKEKIF